jgi:hypothetical protein
MHRAIRGLSQSTGWKWRTKVESPLAKPANRVFANASACFFLCPSSEFFGWFGVRLVMRPVDPVSAKKVRATPQGAIRKIRTSDNRRWPQPILDALRVKHRESDAEAQRKSGSHRPSEEYSFSQCEKSALNRPPLFRVRRIFDYHSRGGSHSLFRDRTASAAADALQSVNAPTAESVHGAWRSPQLLSD